MRSILSSFLFASLITGCTEASLLDDDQGADINDGIRDDDKADGATGIEVMARLRPGTVDTKLTTAAARQGYIFFAAEGTKVTLEVTQAGTKAGLDTMIKVYGPRLSDGSYPKTLATDEDAGFGKLSKIKDLEISIPGFYLVEVTNGAKATAPAADAKLRLKLSCTGTCDSDLPVAPLGNDIKWFQRAAERKALSLQAYSLATAKLEEKAASLTSFAVVMDIDETTLDNSTIQHERADLGLGFSQTAWTAWVNRKAATPLPGALAFTKRVRELGGKLVFVSNRLAATECAQTEDNLHATGFEYDGILCKTVASEKNTRFDSITNGTSGIAGLPALPIAMFVGDNIQDFPLLTQDIRKQPDAAFAKFGDSFFLLPNPMYGSWEKNLD
jgi:5'-nucleotidase (lipoprotein e(P4) family)